MASELGVEKQKKNPGDTALKSYKNQRIPHLSKGNFPIAEFIRQLSKGQILTTLLFRPLSKPQISSLECCRFGEIPKATFQAILNIQLDSEHIHEQKNSLNKTLYHNICDVYDQSFHIFNIPKEYGNS